MGDFRQKKKSLISFLYFLVTQKKSSYEEWRTMGNIYRWFKKGTVQWEKEKKRLEFYIRKKGFTHYFPKKKIDMKFKVKRSTLIKLCSPILLYVN